MNPHVQLTDVNLPTTPTAANLETPTGNLAGRDVRESCEPVETRIQELSVNINLEATPRQISYFQSYEFQERCRTAGIMSTAMISIVCAIAGVVFTILGFYKYAHGQGGQGDMFLALAIGVGFCLSFACGNASVHCFDRR